MENFQILQNMKPEELQELLQIYRAKSEGQNISGQMHKPVMVNSMEESLLASLPNTTGHIDPMTGLRSYYEGDMGGFNEETGGFGNYNPNTGTFGTGTDSGSKDRIYFHPDSTEKVTYNQFLELEAAAAAGTFEEQSTGGQQSTAGTDDGYKTKVVGTDIITQTPDGKGGYTYTSTGDQNMSGVTSMDQATTIVQNQQGGSQQGGSQQGVVTPKQFLDEFGNSYTSQDLADAANAEISQQRYSFTDFIKGHILTDTDLETLKLGLVPPEIHKLKDRRGNPIDLTFKEYMSSVYPNLPDSELEKIFNEQKSLILKTAGPQIKQFTDKISQILQNKTETIDGVVVTTPRTQGELESLVFDDIASELAGEGNLLSEDTKRTIFQTVLDTAVRKQAFTLTPGEIEEFARPDKVPIIATSTNFAEWWASKGGIEGQYTTEEAAKAAWEAAQITDASAPTIDDFDEATAPTVTATDDITAPTLDTVGDITADTITTTGDVTAPTLDTVGDIDAATVEGVTVGTVTESPKVTVANITGVDIDDISAIDNFNDLITKLEDRIDGKTTSPAELQLKTATETNMKSLLGATVGAQADPTRIRQLRNIWAEMQQAATGQASQLRSEETIAAENALIAVAKEKGSLELQVELANLETRRQKALKDADLESVRTISIMQMNLARVIAQAQADVSRTTTQAELTTQTRIANLDKEIKLAIKKGDLESVTNLANQQTRLTENLANLDAKTKAKIANLDKNIRMATEKGQLELAADISNQKTTLQTNIAQADIDVQTEIANLEARRIKAVEEGKMDLAVALANLEKDVILAQVNSSSVLQAMALDDAIALAAYKGQQNLYTIETQIDIAQMEFDIKEMGFTIQKDLALMDDATKRYIANLTKQYKDAANDTNRQGIILQMISTGLAAYASYKTGGLINSDIRMKKNISSADREIEQFLDAIDAYQYEYKDPNQPGADSGLLIGIMAQDAERGGPMGQSMVTPGPHGKMLDQGHGMAAVLAAQANLHKRTKQLEGRA